MSLGIKRGWVKMVSYYIKLTGSASVWVLNCTQAVGGCFRSHFEDEDAFFAASQTDAILFGA